MSEFAKIFDAMRASPMNDWVGGTDPELVGDASAAVVRELLPIDKGSKVLDFGCGIGRVITSLLKIQPTPQRLVGMDIIPQVIEFCESHLSPSFPCSRFELVHDSNTHYDRFIGDERRKSKAELSAEYSNHFTDGYAFSVFTHIDRNDFEDVLSFVSEMMAPGGRFLFTCFALTEHSRKMIESRQSLFPFEDCAFVENGDVFWGDRSDPLAFIAFDRKLLEKMVWNAGLAITKVHYGCWMGGSLGSALQDVFVARKPMPLLDQDEITATPLVDRAKLA